MSLCDKRIFSTPRLRSKHIECAAGAYIELTEGQYIESLQRYIDKKAYQL